MLILPFIENLNTILMKISVGFFVEIDEQIL
jgi:hypothetical protein